MDVRNAPVVARSDADEARAGVPPRRIAGAAWVAIAALSLVARLGFTPGPAWAERLLLLDLTLVGAMILDLLWALIYPREASILTRIRGRWFDWTLLVIGTATILAGPSASIDEPLLAEMRQSGFGSLLEAVVVTALLLLVIQRLLRAQEWVLAFGLPPVLLLAVSFLALIGIGTLLLLVPRAAADPALRLSPIEALFTATSAVCVTGLSVFDVGSRLSLGGEAVLLVLIQLGGLGIVTFVVTLSVVAGRDLSVPQLQTLKEMVNASALADVRRQIRDVAAVAFVVELIGAALLFSLWPHDEDSGLLHRAWTSLFHAVSAFCNAGFSLSWGGIDFAQERPLATLVVTLLIFIGGLGFPVLRELVRRPRKRGGGMSLQTRLVLGVSAVLILSGALLFWLIEGGSPVIALFESVSARTAGFTAVPIAELHDATLVLLVLLMAVGAGPISTGGGIKTVTLGVLLFTVRAMLRGRDRVEVGARTLPAQAVQAALSVFVLYVLAAITITFALALLAPEFELHDLAFEGVSALSTVGLSTGITPGLGNGALLVLCAAMFVGRVGPLTLAMVIFGRRRATTDYDYPEEDVIIG